MNLSKLRKLHVIIIGSVLCAIAIGAQYWFLIKPRNEAFDKAKKEYEAALVLGNPQAEQDAIAKRNDALVKKSMAEQALQVQFQRRMPNLNFARRDLGMLQLWNEQIRKLGPLLNNFADDPSMSDVKASFSIQAPPLSPNAAVFDQPILQFQGTVQVTATSFQKLMNNIIRWNNCGRLVMVGPPAIGGNVPNLMASYNLTCYIFPASPKAGPTSAMWGPADQANNQQY